MRSGASSTARAREKFVSAALAPAYTAKPAAPRCASIVVKFTMLPPLPPERRRGSAEAIELGVQSTEEPLQLALDQRVGDASHDLRRQDAEPLHRFLDGRGIDVTERDDGPGPSEGFGDCGADSTAATDDDRGLAGKIEAFLSVAHASLCPRTRR